MDLMQGSLSDVLCLVLLQELRLDDRNAPFWP